MVIVSLDRYGQPLGFTYKDVWLIDIDTRLPFDSIYNASKRATVEQLLIAVRQMPEVERVCAWAIPPYSNNMSTWGGEVNGKRFRIAIHHGSEESKDVLCLQLVEGRWFEAGGGRLNSEPGVIHQMLSRERLGTESRLRENAMSPGC